MVTEESFNKMRRHIRCFVFGGFVFLAIAILGCALVFICLVLMGLNITSQNISESYMTNGLNGTCEIIGVSVVSVRLRLFQYNMTGKDYSSQPFLIASDSSYQSFDAGRNVQCWFQPRVLPTRVTVDNPLDGYAKRNELILVTAIVACSGAIGTLVLGSFVGGLTFFAFLGWRRARN